MILPAVMQGRPFGIEQLANIQDLLKTHPDSSRYELSRRLATLWNWRTASGQLKDMAARTLLLKLQAQGWIELPERRRASPSRSGRVGAQTDWKPLDETPLQNALSDLGPSWLSKSANWADLLAVGN